VYVGQNLYGSEQRLEVGRRHAVTTTQLPGQAAMLSSCVVGMASVLGSTDVRVTDLGSFMILPSTSSRCVRCPTSVFVMELGERPNEFNNSDGDTEQWLTVQRKGSKKSRCKLKDLGQVTETAILEDWT
jgi:hypothetical protein